MRASGILMPISSLPSAHGIGAMGAEARRFVEFLSKAGQAYWQILPICPTSYGDSPYQSFSTFAGNPYFIDLDELAKRGLLLPEEYENIDWESAPDTINYGALYEKRYKVLRCAANRLLAKPNAAYRKFVKENAFWLPDYALFMALKDAHGGACWLEWEEPLRRREPEALKAAREQYADDVAFWQVVQYLFYAQWNALKGYANRMKIDIIGDLPIYVALDSVDVWSCPQEFQLDENLLPTEVAGCPPDGFSATGQLWGNPLFDWDAMAKTGYAWWVRRIRHMCSIYDVVRIDHFRDGGDYRPHSYPNNCIAYVGTHDNEPVNGWMETAAPEDVERAVRYLNLTKKEGYHWGMMRGVWSSVADLAVVQAQDVLGLGHESRMNTPSTLGGNWCWRAEPGVFNSRLARRLHDLMELYGRLPE